MLSKFCASLVVAATMASSAHSGTDSLVTFIGFENLPEGTPISDQYSGLGVSFAIEGNPALLPVIVVEGGELPTGFVGPYEYDSPMADGIAGLTDPSVDGDYGVPNDIRINFDPPVTSVHFYLLDLDGSPPDEEHATITAYGGEGIVQFVSLQGDAEKDGACLEVSLAGNEISSILIDVTPCPSTGRIGWALDSLSFARPGPSPGSMPRFRVSQESAPQAGDFASHILGEVPLWVAPSNSAADLYGYDAGNAHSWSGTLVPLEAETSHLFGALTTDGVALFIVHERPISHEGKGEAELQIEVLDDADGATFLVQDDPSDLDDRDIYDTVPPIGMFTIKSTWETCCTDGFVIGHIARTSSILVQFAEVDDNSGTPPIAGLNQWNAYGSNGTSVPLSLVTYHRVRIDILPPSDSPADLNGDNTVDAADLGILLGAWGATTSSADIDGSGDAGATDLAILLGAWAVPERAR